MAKMEDFREKYKKGNEIWRVNFQALWGDF